MVGGVDDKSSVAILVKVIFLARRCGQVREWSVADFLARYIEQA